MHDRRGSSWGWILGAIALLLLVGALAFSWNDSPTTTAGTDNPSASAPATTGSAAGSAPAQRAPGSNVPPANAPAR
jgi:hypothetical protein